jgi:hypothetical protein
MQSYPFLRGYRTFLWVWMAVILLGGVFTTFQEANKFFDFNAALFLVGVVGIGFSLVFLYGLVVIINTLLELDQSLAYTLDKQRDAQKQSEERLVRLETLLKQSSSNKREGEQ